MPALYRKALALLASKARPWLATRRAQVVAWLSANLPEWLAFAGAFGITRGAGLFSEAAGWIVGGAFSIAGAVLVTRGRQVAAEKAERARRGRDR